MSKPNYKDPYWGRNYPRRIHGIKEGLVLKQITWGRRLIYNVYEEESYKLLGSCRILERVTENPNCKNKSVPSKLRFIAMHWSAAGYYEALELRKRVGDVQRIFCNVMESI